MRSLNGFPAVAAFGLVVVLSGLLVLQARATRPVMASPTSVVSIDLPRVLDNLDQRVASETKLREMAETMIEEEEDFKRRQTALQEELKAMPQTNSALRLAKTEELALLALEFQAWTLYATEQLDIEKSLMLRDIDRSVQEAINELAELNGYDVVLMNDSAKVLSLNPQIKQSRESQVRQQMSARRVLYVNNASDITDQLIQRMNNAYNAKP